MFARIFHGHAQDLDGLARPERRDGVRGDTPRPERETDLAFQVVIPAHCLFIRTGIDDRFVVDAVFPLRVPLGSFHDVAPRIRRTEVRPIRTRRAISDLLTPARCSFLRISLSNSAKIASKPAMARPAG